MNVVNHKSIFEEKNRFSSKSVRAIPYPSRYHPAGCGIEKSAFGQSVSLPKIFYYLPNGSIGRENRRSHPSDRI
jgi:hypothetical protein